MISLATVKVSCGVVITTIQLEQIETEYEATRKKLEATKRQQKAAMSGIKEVSNRRE